MNGALTIGAALLLGLAASGHCLAMCGGISAALGVVTARGADGEPTRAFEHICWDGCMFPNATMLAPKTWNDVLRTMLAVRDAHGWN